jgi:TRAP-type C4-dicarboxylate transport system permease small subunit
MHDGGRDQAGQSGFVGWYTRIMMSVGAAAMAAILIIMMVQVVARYVFNASLIWAEEICRYILVWITFLFIGLAFQRGELVTVDILTIRLQPIARFALKAVMSVPVVVFLVLMVINSYSFFGRFYMQKIPAIDFIWESITGHAAGVSILWVYHSVTIGCALLVVHIVGSLIAEGRDLVRQRRAPPSTQILR